MSFVFQDRDFLHSCTKIACLVLQAEGLTWSSTTRIPMTDTSTRCTTTPANTAASVEPRCCRQACRWCATCCQQPRVAAAPSTSAVSAAIAPATGSVHGSCAYCRAGCVQRAGRGPWHGHAAVRQYGRLRVPRVHCRSCHSCRCCRCCRCSK